MCTIDAFIDRYTSTIRDRLGMSFRVTSADDGLQQIVLKIVGLWCSIPVTAPADPELVMIRCQFNAPPDLPRDAVARSLARANTCSALSKCLQVEDSVIVTVASVAAPADCLPTPRALATVLPRLRSAMAFTLRTLNDEFEFERLASSAIENET